MSSQYIFTMHRLSKVHPPDKTVLENITLAFFPGAKIGVLGYNGAGKSTLLRIMAGVDQEYRGEAQLAPGATVGMLEQEPAERDAAALAAGELRDVRIARREPQRVHRVVELGVEVPGVGGFDVRLDAPELLGVLLGVVGGELVEAIEQRLGLGHALLDVSTHVLALVERGLLLEHADRGPRGQRGVAAVLLVPAGHDPQQRRLAGPVVTQHADLGARVEGQRDVVQDGLVGLMHLGQPVHREDVLRGHRHAA